MRKGVLLLTVLMVMGGYPLAGADFVTTAMSGLPTQTMRVEYSSPSKLRKLPNFQGLRGKFLGRACRRLRARWTKSASVKTPSTS